MNPKELMRIFESTGALLKGHFSLSSGLHSGQYLQCALILQHPKYAASLCAEIAKRFEGDKVTVVCGPALGAVVVSYEVARAMSARSIFCERREGKMILSRGFSVGPDDSVLVVEDVITTGTSVKEIIEIMRRNGAKVGGIGGICDRSSQLIDFGARFESLIKLDIKNYPAQDCPLCKEGIPIQKPGSKMVDK